MELKIRKLVNFEEEIHLEGERKANPPLRMLGGKKSLGWAWLCGGSKARDPRLRACARQATHRQDLGHGWKRR